MAPKLGGIFRELRVRPCPCRRHSHLRAERSNSLAPRALLLLALPASFDFSPQHSDENTACPVLRAGSDSLLADCGRPVPCESPAAFRLEKKVSTRNRWHPLSWPQPPSRHCRMPSSPPPEVQHSAA